MPTISLLYQDRHLIVCEKPAGILTQPDAAHPSDPASDMLAALSQQLSSSHHPTPEIYPVHRLDRGVGGIMVFASSRAAAGKLSDMVAKRAITKQYLAVVHGHPTTEKGMLEDLLYRDAATGKSYVSSRPRPGAKEAALTYEQRERLNDSPVGPCSLLKITLHTGRTHQIRVQFSSRGMPLVGDGKYGARDHGCPLGLWSYRIAFDHPFRRHEVVDFSLLPPAVPPSPGFPLFPCRRTHNLPRAAHRVPSLRARIDFPAFRPSSVSIRKRFPGSLAGIRLLFSTKGSLPLHSLREFRQRTVHPL